MRHRNKTERKEISSHGQEYNIKMDPRLRGYGEAIWQSDEALCATPLQLTIHSLRRQSPASHYTGLGSKPDLNTRDLW